MKIYLKLININTADNYLLNCMKLKLILIASQLKNKNLHSPYPSLILILNINIFIKYFLYKVN